MAGGTAAGAVVAGSVVRAEKAEQRIVQPRLLRAEKDGVGAVQGAQATGRQASVGFAGRLVEGRETERELIESAFLEDAEQVAGLAHVEALQRIEEWQDAVLFRLFGSWFEWVVELQRRAVRAIGLADDGVLHVDRAVVVSGGVPEHAAVVHHRVTHALDDVAVAQPARFFRHAQVAGIDEADELGRLVVKGDVGVGRVGGSRPDLGMARGDVRLHEHEAAPGVAAVAVRAAEDDIGRDVHGVRVGRLMAVHAACALRAGGFGRLVDPVARRARRGGGRAGFPGGGRAKAGALADFADVTHGCGLWRRKAVAFDGDVGAEAVAGERAGGEL